MDGKGKATGKLPPLDELLSGLEPVSFANITIGPADLLVQFLNIDFAFLVSRYQFGTTVLEFFENCIFGFSPTISILFPTYKFTPSLFYISGTKRLSRKQGT